MKTTKLKYEAYRVKLKNRGTCIKNQEWFQSGIIECDYIPGIISYEEVFTHYDLNGPVFHYYNCDITEDFGPVYKGEIFKDILLDYDKTCPHIHFTRNNKEAIYIDFEEIAE